MAWGRCDDNFWRHPKVLSLDPKLHAPCCGLYWQAISYCNDLLTDGAVPAAMLTSFHVSRRHADELVRVGLWERNGRDYLVHDFLKFNKSKEQIIRERGQKSLTGEIGAMARWHGTEPSHGAMAPSMAPSNGTDDAPVTRYPYPVDIDTEQDALSTYYNLTARFPSGRVLEWLTDIEQRHGRQRTVAMLATKFSEDKSVHTLLGRVQNALRAEDHAAEKREKEDELIRLREKRRPDPLYAQIKAAMEARDAAGGDS